MRFPILTALLVGALFAPSTSCSRSPNPGGPEAGVVRLVDLADDAEVRGAESLDQVRVLQRETLSARYTVPSPLGEYRMLDAAVIAPKREGAWRLSGPKGALVVRIEEKFAAGWERMDERKRQARLEQWLSAFFDRGESLPVVDVTRSGRIVLVAPPPEGGGAAVFTLERISARSAFLEKCPRIGRGPLARRVTIGRSVRESLLLAPGMEVRFRFRAPAGPLVFESMVDEVLGDGDPPLRVEFAARPIDEPNATLRLERGVPGDGSAEIVWELPDWGGRTLEWGVRVVGDEEEALVVFSVPTVASAAETSSETDVSPDVVWISLDTVRADRCSLYGAERPTTPNLEALARESVVFDRAIAPAPWTLPSHSSTLSGLHVDRHGVVRSEGRIPSALPWLPLEFRRRGYRTWAYTGGGYLHPRFGYPRGFEEYRYTDPVNPPAAWAARRPKFQGSDMVRAAEQARRERAHLLEALAERRGGPRFFFIHTYQAHDYRADPERLRAFGARESEIELLLDGIYGPRVEVNPFMRRGPDDPPIDELRRLARIVYDAALFEADRFVGEVVEAIRRSGRWDRTILVVSSDHGESLLENGKSLGHGNTLREEVIHVPLILRVPGLAPRRIPDVVSTVDVVPTLRRLLGWVEKEEPLPFEDGRSIVALLRGEPQPARPALSRGGGKTVRQPAFRSLRGERFKIVEYERRDEDPRVVLRDLVADPLERRDHAGERPEIAARLLERLHELVARLRERGFVVLEAAVPEDVKRELHALGYLGGD